MIVNYSHHTRTSVQKTRKQQKKGNKYNLSKLNCSPQGSHGGKKAKSISNSSQLKLTLPSPQDTSSPNSQTQVHQDFVTLSNNSTSRLLVSTYVPAVRQTETVKY